MLNKTEHEFVKKVMIALGLGPRHPNLFASNNKNETTPILVVTPTTPVEEIKTRISWGGENGKNLIVAYPNHFTVIQILTTTQTVEDFLNSETIDFSAEGFLGWIKPYVPVVEIPYYQKPGIKK